MADKLIAFFNTHDEAERVQNELESAGFDHDDARIFSQNGPSFWRDVKEAFGFADERDRYLYDEAARRGATALLVDFDDADSPSAQTALQIIQRHHPLDLEGDAKQASAKGAAGQVTTAQASTATRSTHPASTTTAGAMRSQEGKQVVPVVEEKLQVGKRVVNRGGVRIHTKITERPVQEEVSLQQERVNVERRPVDRPVSNADEAFRDRTVEVQTRGEEAVVGKQARVVEEVVVNKDVEQRKQTVRDTVRRSDVEVEKVNPEEVGQTRTTSATGGTFSADDFAAELARDQRYRGRDWSTIENDARTTYQQRYPQGAWDRMKDEISRGYDRLRQKV
jgi:uncharacterized protein (TIGR02271 family)